VLVVRDRKATPLGRVCPTNSAHEQA